MPTPDDADRILSVRAHSDYGVSLCLVHPMKGNHMDIRGRVVKRNPTEKLETVLHLHRQPKERGQPLPLDAKSFMQIDLTTVKKIFLGSYSDDDSHARLGLKDHHCLDEGSVTLQFGTGAEYVSFQFVAPTALVQKNGKTIERSDDLWTQTEEALPSFVELCHGHAHGKVEAQHKHRTNALFAMKIGLKPWLKEARERAAEKRAEEQRKWAASQAPAVPPTPVPPTPADSKDSKREVMTVQDNSQPARTRFDPPRYQEEQQKSLPTPDKDTAPSKIDDEDRFVKRQQRCSPERQVTVHIAPAHEIIISPRGAEEDTSYSPGLSPGEAHGGQVFLAGAPVNADEVAFLWKKDFVRSSVHQVFAEEKRKRKLLREDVRRERQEKREDLLFTLNTEKAAMRREEMTVRQREKEHRKYKDLAKYLKKQHEGTDKLR